MRLAEVCTEAGKLILATEKADSVAEVHHRRLFVTDRATGDRYLVDTGATISVYPAKSRDRLTESSFRLYAANGTIIKTYGETRKTLNISLRRPLAWDFVLANVSHPIIGADFLFHHSILVDLKGRQLVDGLTGLTSRANLARSTAPSVFAVPQGEWYYELLQKYPKVTRPSSVLQEPRHNVEHVIETKGPPVTAKARRLPPDRYNAAKKEFLRMVEEGVCRPSKSSWASPLHIVKKNDGNIRPCGDYRRLNAQTLPDRYNIPNILDMSMILHEKTIFSKLDLNRAYFQIPVAEKDIPKTAIITPFGLFEFLRMCFGLKNAAPSFQRLMDQIFRDLPYVYVYIDDFLIASKDEAEHREHLEEVFRRLNDNGITINPAKCVFCKPEIEFLSYRVNKEGLSPTAKKMEEISAFQRPANKGQLRKFLGMLNYYRRCLPKAAEVQRVLHNLVGACKKSDQTPIVWTLETEAAFEKCKQDICQAMLLAHPSPDADLALACDASNTAIGAVLQQRDGDTWRPLGFFSKALSKPQQSYSAYDRELVAIHRAIRHFRSSIEGRTFHILTDHKPLVHVFFQKPETATPMRIRMANFISQFTTDIRHVSGPDNIVADTLSRLEEIQSPDTMDRIAEEQALDPTLKDLMSKPHLQLKFMNLPNCKHQLLCDTSTKNLRPYVPPTLRRDIFQLLHNLSHPGVRGSRRLISQRFFWPEMNVNIADWVRTCISCQRSKVQRHTSAPPGSFAPSGRFEHVHVDIIGPLPPSSGKRYCLTIIDRYTRWPEAQPLEDISAKSVASALYNTWISRYGVPVRVTTDQGRQFEAELFRHLMQILGIQRCRTTAYHPQSNGCVERWHRSLKTSLTAHLSADSWTELLPTVLLGLRSVIKDNGASPAEMTFGQTLRLPGELLEESPRPEESDEFLRHLREHLRVIRPVPQRSSTSQPFIPTQLRSCSHVFLRVDMTQKPLTPPYTGPHPVLERGEKTFVISLPSGPKTVSIDRIKPAYTLADVDGTNLARSRLPAASEPTRQHLHPASPQPSGNDDLTEPQPRQDATRTTRIGRTIRLPVRFRDAYIGGE